MRLEEVIKRQGEYLERAAVPEGRTDAEWIISAVTGLGRVRLRLEKDAVLTQEQCKETERLCARRAQREPLQYILGTQSFMSLELHTDARALIPRPETELLGEYCVQEIKRAYGEKRPVLLLDMCTGSGALALGIAAQAGNVRAVGADISREALTLAAENCALCGLEDRVSFVRSDLFSSVEGQYDAIVSNPPYIPSKVILSLEPEVRSYEPKLALDGGETGTEIYARLIPQAAQRLKEGGFLALEAEDFEFDAIERMFDDTGCFENFRTFCDYSGQKRFCSAKRK